MASRSSGRARPGSQARPDRTPLAPAGHASRHTRARLPCPQYHVLDGPVLTSTELAAAAAAEDPELETLLKQPLQVRRERTHGRQGGGAAPAAQPGGRSRLQRGAPSASTLRHAEADPRPCCTAWLQVRATPRGRRKAPRLELVTATDQVLRIVRRDLRGGAAVVHIINDVALPVREPAPESFMARRRRLQGRHAQPGAVAAQHA